MQSLAGADAGTGMRGHVGVWGGFCFSAPHYGWGSGGGEEGHAQEHTQERARDCCTYPLATYPFKSARTPDCPKWPIAARQATVSVADLPRGNLKCGTPF